MHQGEIVYQGTSKKGKNLLIRSIQQGDAEQMMEYINTLSQEQTFIRFQGETLSLEEEQKYLDGQLKRLERHEVVQLLTFCDGKLIGNSGIDMQDKIHSHMGVFGISIARDYRGEGIGKLLMQCVLQEAIKHIPSLRIVVLNAFASNPQALGMYKKFGFVGFGMLPKGIFYKGEYEDYVYLYKNIRE
jgi:RimJ/RimL family protein N-acetyltransferase